MKMPRSQCESENVQFVQELAEVDGPFESPININFRDLTKLELPSLVWNRGDTCPKKMKITNTGHTVILSGKWKCERPYLTGGPLAGKYVFSQIHFHWGQDDCKGSEHQVCGDGFPLEMHVAHFKTEYLTQECALREKDGMVVVVYLFKLQDEPNQSLKKIINLLPCVKQPSTSHAIDPKPILSFCHPFTDDYFMYWGSVVTSTCAHILLWIICREPFGISRDQVNEFRKIMDSSQQPIFRNSRDIQPLHKRNVFHVNASKHLDDPLLPVKKLLGCFCKQSGENITADLQQAEDCKCQATMQNQEECEGGIVEYTSGNHCSHAGGVENMKLDEGLPSSCFHHNQNYFVQSATVHSLSLVKRFGSDPVRNRTPSGRRSQLKPKDKLLSKSCCFLPQNELNKMKKEKRKTRGKRPFNSISAFSQIMHSLEALKNQTFKKLKEIESINQEIKGMKSYCQGNEDKRWIRKIEKIMRRRKRFTIKPSQGCLGELKKLAKDCNLDRIFDCKALTANENSGRLVWVYNDGMTKENLCSPNTCVKQEVKVQSENLAVSKATTFSPKTQKLLQRFFEDIQETDELHQTVKKDLKLNKINSFCNKQAGDSNSISSVIKGFITTNMFVSGNLGDAFFTEVTTEDFESDGNPWEKLKKTENLLMLQKLVQDSPDYYEDDKEKEKEGTETYDVYVNSTSKNENLKPRRNESGLSETTEEAEAHDIDTLVNEYLENFSNKEKQIPILDILSDKESTQEGKEMEKPQRTSNRFSPNVEENAEERKPCESESQKFLHTSEENCDEDWDTQGNPVLDTQHSSSNLSTDSTGTQRMIIAKIRRRRSRRDSWGENSSDQDGKSYASPYEKSSCKAFEGYYIHKKNHKTKKRKKQKGGNLKYSGSSSREASKVTTGKWKNLTKAKFKLEIEKTSETLLDLAFDNSIISPKRKKMKLQSQKGSPRTPKENKKPADGADQDNDVTLTIEARLEKDNQVSKAADKDSPKNRNEWKSASKTLIDSSADSKTTLTNRKEADGDSSFALEGNNNNCLIREYLKHAESKSKVRSRSLARIPTEPRTATEITQRLCLESLDGRRKNKEVTDIRRLMESPKKAEEAVQANNDPSHRTSTEMYDSDTEQKEIEIPEQNKLKYEIGFFTTASSQVDEELMPKAQEIKVKNPVLKRCDADKYQFLEKRPCELSPTFQECKEDLHDILHQTDSNKSFTKDASKGDSDPQNIGNKDLETPLSYLRLKKNSPSRPHSAETLNSLTKTFKRKGKKRPHCCKRISRHYIRKNSSIIKKPHKTESKQLNFLSLTDQEQLKIISVNVAKYLKQKLIEENKGLDPGKTSIDNIEEAVFTKLKDTQGNKEEKPPKEKEPNKDWKTKQNKIPVVKWKDKKKEKLSQSESKAKIKQLKPQKETKIEKPVCVSSKPANNFIKLNKEMAGKYKKATSPPEKRVEPKQKQQQKPCPETATKDAGKFKTKIPKIRVERSLVPKTPDQAKARPETPSTPKRQKQSPTRTENKESKLKSPVVLNKTGLKIKKATTSASPSKSEQRSRELMPCQQTPTETVLATIPVPTASPEKAQHLVPAYTLTSYLPAPIEIVESQKRKVNRYLLGLSNPGLENFLPDVLYDSKSKKVKDTNDVFMKELEYFIKLHMLDISANIEKSMNCLGSTMSQDYFGSSYLENIPVDDPFYIDPCNKEIVLLKMKDVECTSSASDFVEDLDGCTPGRDLMDGKNDSFDKNKDIITVKIPKESGDPGIISSTVVRDRPEETNSDSSYDCKISITLNTNFKAESEPKIKQAEQDSEEGGNEAPDGVGGRHPEDYNRHALRGFVDESSSQSLFVKHPRRKRKENEISLEMKQKLLEILEGEIRREVGIKDETSSENSSEGLTFKWDDSDRNRSQSTVSSCENIEMLTQISDTMRQYLKSWKEKGQLVEMMLESSDKESK